MFGHVLTLTRVHSLYFRAGEDLGGQSGEARYDNSPTDSWKELLGAVETDRGTARTQSAELSNQSTLLSSLSYSPLIIIFIIINIFYRKQE